MNTRFSGGNLNPRVVLIAAVVLAVAVVSVVGNAVIKNNTPVPTTAPPPATVTVPQTTAEPPTTEAATELPPQIDPYAKAIETDADGNTLTVPETAETYFYDRPAYERPNLDSGSTNTATATTAAPANDETDSTAFYDRPAQERQVAEKTTKEPSRPYISPNKTLQFRNADYLAEHYQKHGRQVGATSQEEYVRMAAAVIRSGDAQIRNQVDGDTAYYIPATREFAVLSWDGYIRTYFLASQDYFDRQ